MTARRAGGESLRVAYVVSRFPKLSETFILYEMLELERQGVEVELFPLVRERESVEHREAARLTERAVTAKPFSGSVLAAQGYWLRRRPLRYLGLWARALIGNMRSPRFLARALVAVPLGAFFAREMVARHVDHIHAHWATHPALAAYVASGLTLIPYSFTAHAHDIYVNRSMLGEKIRRARFVVTISDYNRLFLERLYGASAAAKLKVVHCGTDPDLFRPPEHAPADGRWTLVCVASLQPQKGHAFLIQACRRLVLEGVDLRCLLVGEGEERAALEAQIVRAQLGDRVELLGQQPRHRVVDLMSQADVVVQPSTTLSTGKQEGIPVSLIEALAMERAVVASRISGIPELIEDEVSGLLVAERDVAALVEALARLHAEPNLARRLGRNGRLKVLREFNLPDTVQALAGLFAESATRELPVR
jgi:glycosyltransferase involved in cell wall biosynthesis